MPREAVIHRSYAESVPVSGSQPSPRPVVEIQGVRVHYALALLRWPGNPFGRTMKRLRRTATPYSVESIGACWSETSEPEGKLR